MEQGQFKTALPEKVKASTRDQLDERSRGQLDAALAWMDRSLSCSHCRRCTTKCEVLGDPGLDIGEVLDIYKRVMALPEADQVAAVIEEAQARPEFYHALRRCCFCGYCTSTCRAHQIAPEIMRNWRELFSRAGFMPPSDSRMVMVDEEWHIFSAYRAIYGIAYDEFRSLTDVAAEGPGVVDTVLFPGCSLASYTPELVRAVGHWMDAQGFAWALSLDCCGSPLMSAGMFDRAQGLRLRVIEELKAAGVKRFVTICPGCGEEFAVNMPKGIDIVPLPELMLEATADAATAEEAGFSPLPPEDVEAPTSYSVFDACHDRRDNRHGRAIRLLLRKYLPNAKLIEIDNRRKDSLCCGAGGAVGGYDDDLTARRVAQVIDEGRATGSDTLVTMCPTCAYTIGQANLGQPSLGRTAEDGTPSNHYLELLFGTQVDWTVIFAQLEGMWSGEYGPWLNQTFFG